MSDLHSNLASGHSSFCHWYLLLFLPWHLQRNRSLTETIFCFFVVFLLFFWGGGFSADGCSEAPYHYSALRLLCVYSAARCDLSLLPWSLGQEQHCLILLCSTRLQRNFHYFQSCCSFLGGPRHVSAPSMHKYVSVWVCMCVREFVSCCLHIFWINFIYVASQVYIFAKSSTSHRFPPQLISHSCILWGW